MIIIRYFESIYKLRYFNTWEGLEPNILPGRWTAKPIFALYQNCCHAFCFNCIRKTRLEKLWKIMDQYLAFLAGLGQDTSDFDDDHLLDIIQKCPICSKKSDNVIPSRFWSGDPRTKEIYQSEYKKNFEMKKCPYEIFESGLWWPFSKSTLKFCPFPNCTYRHKYQRLQERFS